MLENMHSSSPVDSRGQDKLERIKEGLWRISEKEIREYIADFSKEQLTDLVIELAEKFPVVAGDLEAKHVVATKPVEEVNNLIYNLLSEATYYASPERRLALEFLDDVLARITSLLRALLAAGQGDIILLQGQYLIIQINSWIDAVSLTGETRAELSRSQWEYERAREQRFELYRQATPLVEVILQALRQSELSPTEKVIKLADLEGEDKYALLTDTDEFWGIKNTEADWNLIADELLERVEFLRKNTVAPSLDIRMTISRLNNLAEIAMEHAGRNDEFLQQLIRQGEEYQEYRPLLEYLAHKGMWVEFSEWFLKSAMELSGTNREAALSLAAYQASILDELADPAVELTLVALAFFRKPEEKTYLNMKKQANYVGVWDQLKPVIFEYARSGMVITEPVPEDKRALPPIDITKVSREPDLSFPLLPLMVTIASEDNLADELAEFLDEVRIEELVRDMFAADRAADLLSAAHPEIALAVWKAIVNRLARAGTSKDYKKSERFLKKIHNTLKRTGNNQEWKEFITILQRDFEKQKQFLDVVKKA